MSGEGRLTESQEQLLLQHLDNELGFFSRLRVQFLLRSSKTAREYLEFARRAGDDTARVGVAQQGEVDLWDRISNRIDQEERAALFLGERRRVEPREIGAGRWAPWLLPGVLGSAVTALVMISVAGPATPSGALASRQVEQVQNVQPVAFSAPPSDLYSAPHLSGVSPLVDSDTPQIIEPVEVDWMRSAGGRVRVVSNGPQRDGIIWVRVKRKAPPGAGE